MGKRTAQEIAAVIEPKRSKETIARWARGDTVPSALDVGPLAEALGVKAELLVYPPAVPSYPMAEYLVAGAVVIGGREGEAEDRRTREREARPAPSLSPLRPSRAAGTGPR